MADALSSSATATSAQSSSGTGAALAVAATVEVVAFEVAADGTELWEYGELGPDCSTSNFVNSKTKSRK